MSAQPKPSFLESLLGPVTGTDMLRAEKARLEAFLAAVPGEYCGFAGDGSAVYSEGFLSLLGLTRIQNIHDIQGALDPSDAAALEGMMLRLEEGNKAFTMIATCSNSGGILKLSGSRGKALSGDDSFIILWAEDVTHERDAQQNLQRAHDEAAAELKRLQATLDSLPLPVWIRGGDGNLSWCNQAYGRFVGASPAEAIVQQKELTPTAQDSYNPRDLAAKAMDSGRPQNAQATIIAGGKRRRMLIQEGPLPGAAQSVGLAQDISREEELEKDLTRNLTAHKALLEHLNAAIALFGQDEQLEFFNAAYAALWELEESWLNQKPKLGDVLEKLRENRRLPEQADFKAYKQDWLDMFTRLIDPYEDMLYLPDSSALRMMVIPHPMGGLMMIFEDVTSRLNLESSYNTLIAVQRETLDNLAEGVAVYGGDGRLRLWNPAFTEMWGLSPDEVEPAPHIAQIAAKMLQALPKGSATQDELIAHGLERRIQDGRLTRSDGSLMDYTSVPLPDGGVLVSYSDVTDSVQVEQALREKNVALEAAEQLKTDFLANVSYQLRTPLSSIMGFAEILDNQYFGELNTKQKEYTEGIQEAGARLVGLIDDILDLASFEAGYMEIQREEMKLYDMLQGLHEITQDWAGKHGLSTALKCPKNIGTLKADPKRIKQALLNLIRNAIHHTPLGGTVTLSAKRSKETGTLEISISDTGPGVPEEEQKRIFEPFERGVSEPGGDENATLSNQNKSAGLGLSIVHNIMQLHGGDVRLESAESKGSTFTLTFPESAA